MGDRDRAEAEQPKLQADPGFRQSVEMLISVDLSEIRGRNAWSFSSVRFKNHAGPKLEIHIKRSGNGQEYHKPGSIWRQPRLPHDLGLKPYEERQQTEEKGKVTVPETGYYVIRSLPRSILVMHLLKDWNYSHVIETVLSGPFIDKSLPGGIVTSGYAQAFDSLMEIQKELANA